MAEETQLPGFPDLRYVECQTSRTVRAGTLTKMASAASQLATGRPTKTIQAHDLRDGETHRVSFTRTSADINTLYLAWFYRVGLTDILVGDTLAVKLVIRDAVGNHVGPSDARIPYAFQDNAIALAITSTGPANPSGRTVGGEGWLDLDGFAGAGGLLGDDWSFEFTVTRAGPGGQSYVDSVFGFEAPRSTVRAGAAPDDDAAGALTGPFNPGNPITAGTVDTLGLLRLEQTLQAAVARCAQYLSLTWPCDITGDVPQTTSSTFDAFVHLRESAGVPVPFVLRVSRKYTAAPPGTPAGELGRYRVLFYVAGGGTAQVRLSTGATASPYATAALTGASWQWSGWVNVALPTNATTARLTIEGLTSAGTLYLAGILVEERAP
ncbi:MAG: hypothetical protein JWM10_3000 [Myxococcaceae bacterium]|nr:hypothetical protein [Myxococcaceae bacterium]